MIKLGQSFEPLIEDASLHTYNLVSVNETSARQVSKINISLEGQYITSSLSVNPS